MREKWEHEELLAFGMRNQAWRRQLVRLSIQLPNAAKGYVLLAILFFLQVFAFMGFYSLFRVAESMKHNRLFFEQERSSIQAQKALMTVEQRAFAESDRCHIPITPPAEIALKNEEWWQWNGCNDNTHGFLYYYVIEWLDDDDCGCVGPWDSSPLWVARYYRLTVYLPVQTIKAAKKILQSTIAVPIVAAAECKDKKYHRVSAGRQMWREI